MIDTHKEKHYSFFNFIASAGCQIETESIPIKKTWTIVQKNVFPFEEGKKLVHKINKKLHTKHTLWIVDHMFITIKSVPVRALETGNRSTTTTSTETRIRSNRIKSKR